MWLKRHGLCASHGGGKRCQHAGCSDGKHCHAHGGGRRLCQELSCSKLEQGGTGYCIARGGGRRCQYEGCPKPAQTGKAHSCLTSACR